MPVENPVSYTECRGVGSGPMAYPLPFVKCNIEGHFGNSSTNKVERWQAGFHLTKNGGVIGGTTELTSFLTAIRSAVVTFHALATVSAGTSCWVSDVSGAYIGTDGNYALGSLQSTTRVPLTTITAGANATTAPYSQAVVLSLRSLLLRGPASHGRIYYPATGLGIAFATGALASSNTTGISAAAATMLNTFNTQASLAFGSGTNVGLVSPNGLGFQSPVIRVGVGQRMDHMESRERDIPESHVFTNLTLATALLEDQDDDFRRRMQEEFGNDEP